MYTNIWKLVAEGGVCRNLITTRYKIILTNYKEFENTFDNELKRKRVQMVGETAEIISCQVNYLARCKDGVIFFLQLFFGTLVLQLLSLPNFLKFSLVK